NVIFLLFSVYLIRLKLGIWPYFFVIASAGVLYSFQLLQLAPITTFLLSYALLFSRKQPLLSGLALSVLTIKPQYGLLVPVFLIASKDWRAFWVAAFASSALMLISIALYGAPVWQAFISSMTGGVHSIQFEVAHNIMITVGQSLGKLGVVTEWRAAAQLMIIPICAVFVWYSAKNWCREGAVALSLLAMALAAPSFIFYDWLIYAMAVLLMIKVVPKWTLSLQVFAALLWIAPVMHDVIYQYDKTVAFYFSSFMPVLAVSVMVLAVRSFRRQGIETDKPSYGAQVFS
ncbi:MAG: glycosyltransferase family 87 protein, partial [Pseudomonadota bacterium]